MPGVSRLCLTLCSSSAPRWAHRSRLLLRKLLRQAILLYQREARCLEESLDSLFTLLVDPHWMGALDSLRNCPGWLPSSQQQKGLCGQCVPCLPTVYLPSSELRNIHGVLQDVLSLTARFVPSSQKGTRSQPSVSPSLVPVALYPAEMLCSFSPVMGSLPCFAGTTDNIGSLCFISFRPSLPKRRSSNFSPPAPGISRDLYSPGPKSFQLEIIAPSSQLTVLYFYFSPFMRASLANSIVGSSRASGVISSSWFAQDLCRVDTRKPRNRLRPRPGNCPGSRSR